MDIVDGGILVPVAFPLLSRRRRELDEAIYYRRKKRRFRRNLVSAGPGVIPSPVRIVTGENVLGQRFFEMPGMPNGVLGVFTGEIVHTLGGTWIWTGFSWESYIYPG